VRYAIPVFYEPRSWHGHHPAEIPAHPLRRLRALVCPRELL